MAARHKRSSSAAVARHNKRSSSAAVAQPTLSGYRQKRDFSKTPEPKAILKKRAGRRYLIQKHDATRLHYDFRLELDGVLKSWAVTRGPSLDPHDRRLAVEVEDHPVSYGSFEGIIPKGQYGGGMVMLWDEGKWEPIGDPHKGLAKGKLEFKLHGKRLTGEWTLVRMKDREKDRGRHNWLLIKRTDDAAHVGDHDALLAKNATSIVSGRTMEEIAGAHDRVWNNSPLPLAGGEGEGKFPHLTSPASGGGKTNLTFYPPQLATLTDAMPEGKDWVHEVKFDGYRGLAYIDQDKVTIYTRTGQDWTHKFSALAGKLAKLPVKTAIVDGEIVALDEKGASSFKALQHGISEGASNALQYYAFDLLHLNGKDVRHLPLLARKALLKPLLKPTSKHLIYSEHFTRSQQMLERMCKLGLEGVISKRADAPYLPGRGTAWLKTKCHKRQEFVIGGFTPSSTGMAVIGSLLLGYYQGKDFVYAGRVGTGFNHATARMLYKTLSALKRGAMAYTKYSDAGRRGAGWKRGVVWVEPKLVCEVEFTEWTEEGALRHPSFQGLREDKPAKDIGRDMASPFGRRERVASGESNSKRKNPLPKGERIKVGGITISHPDRIIYPGTNIAKADLAAYYWEVAETILPYVKNRPLSMLRCPEGTGDACFFQRHIARGQSAYLHDTGIRVKGRDETYLMIKDVKGLITLAQWGVIELHPWGCLADKPELADRMIFDLDPDPALPFASVIEGVKEVRERMREFGLESFVKTTGGKGLHVVVPMTRHYDWDTIKAFARAVADSMQHDNPARYIAKASKEARKGKIFVDYLRNDLTSTAIAPFSARAREGATVATPVSWKQLTASLKPKDFTINTVPAYLAKLKADPWEEFFKIKQRISTNHLKALNIEF